MDVASLIFREFDQIYTPLSKRMLRFSSLSRVKSNLVPRAFLRRGEDGREKTLASIDHMIFKDPKKVGCNKLACNNDCK